jgi:hypothetical protein
MSQAINGGNEAVGGESIVSSCYRHMLEHFLSMLNSLNYIDTRV